MTIACMSSPRVGVVAPIPPPAPTLTESPAAPETLELTFAGDVMFGRFVPRGFKPIRAEQHDPFAEVSHLLRSDLAIVNLETPVMATPPLKSPWGTSMRFVATPERIATLSRHGITLVTLANNHWYDMREAGLAETVPLLAAAGIRAVGAPHEGKPRLTVETVHVRGFRLGIIAAAAVNNTAPRPGRIEAPYFDGPALRKPMLIAIAAARADHDLVLILVHWGREYANAPHDWQVRAAHDWIDAGADAVVGHHPHVLQGIERYSAGVIAYSLGNFVFDNVGGYQPDTGVLRLSFRRRSSSTCLEAVRFHPVRIVAAPVMHPRPAGTYGSAIIERMIGKSAKAPLTTTLTVNGEDLVTAGACPKDALL